MISLSHPARASTPSPSPHHPTAQEARMYIIGENIHILSPKVKQALADREGAFFV